MDTGDGKNGLNKGLHSRFSTTICGKIAYLEGPLALDLFQQPKLLVNGVSIGIKLWLSQNVFRLMTGSLEPNYKVQIVDARFKLCV